MVLLACPSYCSLVTKYNCFLGSHFKGEEVLREEVRDAM